MALLCVDRTRSHRCDDFPAATSGRDWKRSPGPADHLRKDVDLGRPARQRRSSKVRTPGQLQLGASASQTSGGRLRTLPRDAMMIESAFPTSLGQNDRASYPLEQNATL